MKEKKMDERRYWETPMFDYLSFRLRAIANNLPKVQEYYERQRTAAGDARQSYFKEWVQSRPGQVQRTMLRFPPFALVKTKTPGLYLCPANIGEIASWTEDGDVSVVEYKNPLRGFCDPDDLVLVDEGPIGLTRVKQWIDEAPQPDALPKEPETEQDKSDRARSQRIVWECACGSEVFCLLSIKGGYELECPQCGTRQRF